MVQVQDILQATNGGLDVILYYYPQARDFIDGKVKKFKIRDENTASVSIKKFGDFYKVTDFGGEGTAKNCFDIVQEEEGVNFKQALHILAARYGIDTTLKAEVNKATIESRKANADEKEGDFKFIAKEKLTEAELKVLGERVTAEICAKYSYCSLESYSVTRKTENGKLLTYTYRSNENFPIFMRNCGTFKKIYKPYEYSKEHRFFCNGQKPQNYINGLDEAKKEYAKLIAQADEGEQTKKKLSEIIICSGERDALCCAAMGYFPVWLNSETAKFEQSDYYELCKIAYKIYNIPDNDLTGKRQAAALALKFPDIYTIHLPEWLSNYRDNRGRSCKDLRDYLDLNPSVNDFKLLLDEAPKTNFIEYNDLKRGEINTNNLLFFLKCHNFYKLFNKKTKTDIYIKIDDFKVKEYTPKQVRAFILQDLRKRHIKTTLINLFLNSKRSSTNLVDDLETIELDFSKNTIDSRTLFFNNVVLKVFKDKTIQSRKADLGHYVWEDHICKHNYRELPKSFDYKTDESGVSYFKINEHNSNYFKYLINSSRIFWRQEANENEEVEEKFTVYGSKLTHEQRVVQIDNLLNKIYTLGYLLHRYKDESKAMTVWVMENEITSEDESKGGTGKSFFLRALKNIGICQIASYNGRDKRVTENTHLLDRIDNTIDIMQIDDAARYFDFNYFYGMITGETVVNRKHSNSEELDFKESPIIAFTSNFPPPTDDSATLRRILPVLYSDYYHDDGKGNARKIYDDFNKNLFDEKYTEEEYNADINFLINCLQFFLDMKSKGFILKPPMDNVLKRINVNKMGDNFKEWAEVYFDKESDKLDKLLIRTHVFEKFKQDTGSNKWSMRKFNEALTAFVKYTDYIIELNPTELKNTSGRIQRRTGGDVVECIYLRTKDTINDNF